MVTTFCGTCNAVLDEQPNIPFESRVPCPSCGSTARRYDVAIEGALKLYSNLIYKGKHKSKGKPFIEGFIGFDLFRKLAKWVWRERIIDRENDYYKEVVIDTSTGNDIHRTEEPLSLHRGHGSDKQNQNK